VTFTTTTASVGDDYVLGVKITTDRVLDGTTVNATLGGTASSASITSGATVITFTTSLNKISATAIQIGFYNSTTGSIIKLETATTVTITILGGAASDFAADTASVLADPIVVTLKPHTLKLDAPSQIVLTPSQTATFAITASLQKVSAITSPTAAVVSGNTNVATVSIVKNR